MSRKDYVAIASILKQSQENGWTELEIARELVMYMHHDNPRFDSNKFLKACGL